MIFTYYNIYPEREKKKFGPEEVTIIIANKNPYPEGPERIPTASRDDTSENDKRKEKGKNSKKTPVLSPQFLVV